MRETIRKILKEERSAAPKFDYIRKVANMIADDIEIYDDHRGRGIVVPFIGGWSRTEWFGDKEYDVSYEGGITWDLDEFPIYVKNKYALDIVYKRGLLLSLFKLVKRRLTDRIENEEYN